MQQIMAYETDLLEYGDLFDGNPAVEAKVEALKAAARAELARIEAMGGAVAAIDYMKGELVAANSARLARIEAGETVVVGVNRFTEAVPSPLAGGGDGILVVDPAAEAEQLARLAAWRAARDPTAVAAALAALKAAARAGENVMPPSIAAAKAGVTTGEWGGAMREVFGEYRAPTGVGGAAGVSGDGLAEVRAAVAAASARLGRRVKLLVGKPGLDGHSNGAEQVAVRARDCGMEVIYEGIRLTPARIVNAALEESVHVVGLSILSGSHLPLVGEVMERMRAAGLDDVPVVVGGIIPDADAATLVAAGVARVYTPKDFELNRIMLDIVALASAGARAAA
jgi:(2R)-ethylmalonyl-CoA mutase